IIRHTDTYARYFEFLFMCFGMVFDYGVCFYIMIYHVFIKNMAIIIGIIIVANLSRLSCTQVDYIQTVEDGRQIG
ncbi:hypothetical protein, partial [Lachnospira eligens]|uniref:hypothetical protein n=1 Tax=Lachnospira eligens TaxID=39485 RepID=UPI000FF0D1C1